jgi:hypothetical protein
MHVLGSGVMWIFEFDMNGCGMRTSTPVPCKSLNRDLAFDPKCKSMHTHAHTHTHMRAHKHTYIHKIYTHTHNSHTHTF